MYVVCPQQSAGVQIRSLRDLPLPANIQIIPVNIFVLCLPMQTMFLVWQASPKRKGLASRENGFTLKIKLDDEDKP